MASQDIAKQFRIFGYKIIPIGILSVLSFLFFIIFFITLASTGLILNVFNFWLFLGLLFQIIIYLVFLFILGNIKRIADVFYDSDLLNFRSKIITVSILRIIAYTLLLNGLYMLSLIPSDWGMRYASTIAVAIVTMMVSFVLLFIAAILEAIAWHRLNKGLSIILKENNAKIGAIFCMIGGILDATIIFRVISEIFRIIGYFLLINLSKLTENNINPAPSSINRPIQPTPLQAAPSIRYCPNCGSILEGTEKFCTSCGTEL